MTSPHVQIVRGPLLNPRSDQVIDWFPDGAIAADVDGKISFIGDWNAIANSVPSASVRTSDGIMLPPLIDAHIHIPQFPIRGHFIDGIGPHPEGGPLLAGLNRNVFPAEARFADTAFAESVIRDFLASTLSKGVVGGAAFVTVHAQATRRALEILPDSWSAGMVLMNRNCPENLRTDEPNVDRDIKELAETFGRRMIVTDRFAPVVDSPLRRRAASLAEKHGLRMQTHLNEQIAEKEFVEKVMYPQSSSYTGVYADDGLLAREPILAHCVWMPEQELAIVAAAPGALIAHCPTSNTLLGSGIMQLDRIVKAGVDYAICTDVGASPTTSLLAEAAQFLRVHEGRNTCATPRAALFRITHAPAAALGLADRFGTFAVGKPMSFIEVEVDRPAQFADVDDLIQFGLLRMERDATGLRPTLDQLAAGGLDLGTQVDSLSKAIWQMAERLDNVVKRVTIAGKTV